MAIENNLYKKGFKLLVLGALSLPLAASQCDLTSYENGKTSKVGIIVQSEREEKTSDLEERITQKEKEEIEKTKSEEYSFERFKKALGNRYEPQYEGVFKWDKASPNDKKFYCLIYENPQQIIKEFNQKEKQSYNNFDPSDLPLKKVLEYEKIIPWKLIPNDGNLSESDKLMIFVLYDLGK